MNFSRSKGASYLKEAMKQTAVEWLVRTLNENIDFIPLDKWDEIRNVVQQALAIEKEQMIYSYSEGWHDGQDVIINQINYIYFGGDKAGEQYYNETYKPKKP